MARTKKASSTTSASGIETIEKTLWATADKLRGHMDAAEYKHIVLGLIFLKYISDAFDRRRVEIEAEAYDPEDPDEYLAERVFWVPREARWAGIQAKAKTPEIGLVIDQAMEAIEKANPDQLRDVLPQGYARPDLDKTKLGGVVDLISGIGLGETTQQAQDVLGRVYEYFLGQFASAEGKQGGEFYTPRSVVEVLVGMLAPYKGRVYDPCCGSGGLFVQSERFVEAHGGKIGDVSIYGQESNPTTWRLAKMNLALRGIDANLGSHAADTFHNDLHPDLKADYILANPPFNISDWGGERLRGDKRWQFGEPSAANANFAWVQHMVSKLAPGGTAGFVLANGALSVGGMEGDVRRQLVTADLVDCVVSLPSQLFYSTQIPVSLWFLSRDRAGGAGEVGRPLRDRRGELLFVDARSLGAMTSRTHRELAMEDIDRICSTYHNWRGDSMGSVDVPGFARAVPIIEVAKADWVLTPGRYVGSEAVAVNDEDYAETFSMLRSSLDEQVRRSEALDRRILEQINLLFDSNLTETS